MKTCGRKTEVYSRVVGYMRPTTEWHPGKLEEFKERTPFKISEAKPRDPEKVKS